MSHTLNVEVAETPYRLAEGLMFRKELGENSGMLFKFSYPQVLKFWGLNTYIPLDIAFVSPENKIVKIARIPTMSTKTISSDTDCLMAIEANDGYFANRGIKVGDPVNIDKDEDGWTIIVFGQKEIGLKDVMK